MLLLLLLTTSTTVAQNLKETYSFGLKQYEEGFYDNAVEAFQRVSFFDKGKTYPDVFEKLGDCYSFTGKQEKAAELYERAYFVTKDDSLKRELVFKKTSSLLLVKKYQYALIELFSLEDSLSTYFEKKKWFYLGITHFGLEEYEEAQEAFLNISSGEEYTETVNELFRQNTKVSKKNPMLAKYMSIFIPGSGQFYAGDVKNGINSLAINVGLFSLLVYMSQRTALLDAYVLVFPWWFRYHLGGYLGAEKITIKKIKQRRAEIYRALLTAVKEEVDF